MKVSLPSPCVVHASPLSLSRPVLAGVLAWAGMILWGGTLEARDITVNNNAGAVADFVSLQEALDASEDGDRILIAGSSTSYGTVTLARQGTTVIPRNGLTLVGVGYFRAQNGFPADAAGNNHAAQFSLTVGSASVAVQGLTVIGCDISNLNLPGPHNDILVDRCRVLNRVTARNITRLRFTRSILPGGLSLVACPDSSAIGCIAGGLLLENSAVASHCVITGSGPLSAGGPSSVLRIDATSSASNLIVDVTPSIAGSAPPIITGSLTHSFGLGTAGLPPGAGNVDGLDPETVVLRTGSPDGQWRLTPTSPARLAASDGSDAGAFGGPSPYVLSGIPGAPRITRLLVPALASPTTGLTVELEVIQDTP